MVFAALKLQSVSPCCGIVVYLCGVKMQGCIHTLYSIQISISLNKIMTVHLNKAATNIFYYLCFLKNPINDEHKQTVT
ncbi:hypothetical protein AQUCO_00500146v1 [Aquilegia coerulea]|uniref:Uncharacterized protein n=1 Tax=Aquilegia coerulea TaxID=218851 RepID=A0A2G5EQS9_AQUCA|nr:hypothetical protein AQUCO_00500146v1 [Aquilegia coerulea]